MARGPTLRRLRRPARADPRARRASCSPTSGYTGTSMNEVAEACGVSKAVALPLLPRQARAAGRDRRERTSRGCERSSTRSTRASARARGAAARADRRASSREYAGAQAEHRVLTEDVRFLQPADRAPRARQRSAASSPPSPTRSPRLRPELRAQRARQPLDDAAVRHDELDVHLAAAATAADPRRRWRRSSPTSSSAASAPCAVRTPPRPPGRSPGQSHPGAINHERSACPAKPDRRPLGRQRAPAQRSRARSTAARSHHAHADEIDFGEALDHARRVGVPALLALDFQQRAARLKALAKYLNERKEAALRDLAPHRRDARDSWIDIEGGTGTLFAYASDGRQRAAVGQPGARRPGDAARQEGPASPARTSWCRAAASRCTSTPSTSRSGACSRNSRRASSPACPASSSRPRRPATSPKRWCA